MPMNKIEKLIKELCPNGVEWKKLGEIGYFYGGLSGKTKEDFVNGNAIFITYKNIYSNPKLYMNPIDKVHISKNEKQNIIEYGDVLFTGSSETPDECGISSVVSEKPKENMYLNSFCFGFRLNDKSVYNIGFLSHLFRSNEIRAQIAKTASGVTRFNISKKLFANLLIPLPPLPIQTEIVRILDKFVEQQEQLERLIELRKKQYEYYREELLKPKEGEVWETVTIGDLGTITRGRRFVRDDVRESGMPCIHYGDMYTYYGISSATTKTFLDRDFPKKMQYAKKGDVVIVGAGENDLDIGVGTVWEGEEPAAVHDACYILTHNQNSKYIAYFLRTNNYHQQLRKYVSDGKICSISGVGLGSCLIPIPSLKKQQEIVEFLDKFEFSITALTSALEASRRRYEYYRDEMMRF